MFFLFVFCFFPVGWCSVFVQSVQQQHTLQQRLQLRPQWWEMVRRGLTFRNPGRPGAERLPPGRLRGQRHRCHVLHCHAKQHRLLHWGFQGQRQNVMAGRCSRRAEGREHFASNTGLPRCRRRLWRPTWFWKWLLRRQRHRLPFQVCSCFASATSGSSWRILAL